MASISCLNNYPLGLMLARAATGESPGQHAWGVDFLAERHHVQLAPFHEPGERNRLERLSARLGWRCGQLDQELWALARSSDVIYAADQYSLRGIALLKPWIHSRLVSVIHHPVDERRSIRRATLRHDHLACLSAQLASEMVDLGVPAWKVTTVSWGPDLRSPLYREPRDEGIVVSAGKSNRDLSTLVQALAKTGDRARVYDLDAEIRTAPGNVELVRSGGPGLDPNSPATYLASTVIAEIRRASIVAVSAIDSGRLTGLTEVNDALALGKPIIMTRSSYMPVDVEAVGCGIGVDMGDVQGWIDALSELSDPTVRAEMGANGRRYAEREWNYAIFGKQLEAVLTALSVAE